MNILLYIAYVYQNITSGGGNISTQWRGHTPVLQFIRKSEFTKVARYIISASNHKFTCIPSTDNLNQPPIKLDIIFREIQGTEKNQISISCFLKFEQFC